MAIYKIQGKSEKRKHIYFEFNTDDEPLGEGGMGKVFKGQQVNELNGSRRDVAVKFMYSDLPEHAIERARREASIQIRHDNLVEMLGFIETERTNELGDFTRRYHVVSELLEGVTLDNLLNGRMTDRYGNVVQYAQTLYNDYTRDPEHFALVVIRCILSGLMALHDAGYIHRDIDPTNIMITNDGHIKLIDFGIAKKMNALTSHDKHLTQAGVFMGKPEYAAPELVLGAINEQNQTTDIYAVGVLLYQCIVGHAPFEGDRYDVLRMQQHNKMPLNTIKNKALRTIIAKATEKSRAKRYQSAAEFRVAIDTLKPRQSSVSFVWKPLYTYISSGVAACLIIAIVIAMLLDSEDNPNKPLSPSLASVQTPQSVKLIPTFDVAVKYLKLPEKAKDGFEMLRTLSEKGDVQSMFLFSRLIFDEKKTDEASDSIDVMRKNANVQTDNEKAHELLSKVVDADPYNYKALCALATDYLYGEQLVPGVEQEVAKADKLYKTALKGAKEKNDSVYVSVIENMMDKYKGVI